MSTITGRIVRTATAGGGAALPVPNVGQVVQNVVALRALAVNPALPGVVMRQFSSGAPFHGGGPFIADTNAGTDDGWSRFNAGGLTSSSAGWQRIRTDAVIHAEDVGVTANGTDDDLAPMTRCIDLMNELGGNVRLVLPRGVIKLSASLPAIAVPYAHIEGQGANSTQIHYTGTGAVFDFGLPGLTPLDLSGCSISRLGFNGSGNVGAQKVAIKFRVCSGFSVRDVWCLNWVSAVGEDPSIWLWSQGHETVALSDIVAYADRPIFLDKNPTYPSLDADTYHLHNTSLVANHSSLAEADHPTESCIVIADGANVFNLTSSGANPWLGGTHGLHFEDTGGVASAQGIQGWNLQNIRREQPSAATAGYCFYIKLASRKLTGFVALNVSSGTDPTHGFYFRNVDYVWLQNCLYGGTVGTAINAHGTLDGIGAAGGCVSLSYQNCFFQTGSTLTLTNMFQVRSDDQQPYGMVIPASAVWETTNVAGGSRYSLFDSVHATNGFTGDLAGAIVTASNYVGVGAARMLSGTGSPEGVVTAPVGALFMRTDGGVGTTLYVKETGAGNTGWSAIVGAASGGGHIYFDANGNLHSVNNAGLDTQLTP